MQPKKSLGQNFLRDGEVLRKIIKAADLSEADNVIEIGPGEGALSAELIKRVGRLIMIEKDDKLAEDIAGKFQISNYKNQTLSTGRQVNTKLKNVGIKDRSFVINSDVLDINLPEIFEINDFKDYKIVANIPYYITSPIIRLFLETKYRPKEMILMVQREVAERICAKPGQMSILSVSVQYYATPEILFYVGRRSFFPVPEVDSAIIRITPNAKSEKHKEETRQFFRVVKAGFLAKRKLLVNNLASSLHLEKEVVSRILLKAGLKPTQRAQELSVEDWGKIARLFFL